MRKLFILLLFVSGLNSDLYAQVIGPFTSSFNSIRQKGVSTIAATGDTVWISPA